MKSKQIWSTIVLPATLFFSSTIYARDVIIKNGITDKMEKYPYLFMKIKPTKFFISVNGKKLEQNKQEKFSIKNNKLNVRYDYEFQNGRRKGAKVVTFSIPEKIDELTIKFKWKKKWRVQIKGAKPLSVTPIEL